MRIAKYAYFANESKNITIAKAISLIKITKTMGSCDLRYGKLMIKTL